MTDKTLKREFRNRRFLISLWCPLTTHGSAEERENLSGMVWEADPSQPGRVEAPESFTSLSVLPQVINNLLNHGPSDPGPEEEA